MMNAKTMSRKATFATALSVACVLFGWHAGGGFATGNQANQFYIISGWFGPVSAVIAMLLLTLTVRQAMIMYNLNGLKTYKQLFEFLYHPLDKLEIIFEIYFYIMVLMATSASIAGAGSLFESSGLISYRAAILLIGVILLILTMFGSNLVRKASTVMSVLILICALSIFIIGISHRTTEIAQIFTAKPDASQIPRGILKAFQYAGFQCACIPTMVTCGRVLRDKSECGRSMWISFAMNAVALVLSVFVLLGWRDTYLAIEGGSTIPTLTICQNMDISALLIAYNICLFLCFISTGVASVFGFVSRFEDAKLLQKIKSGSVRRMLLSVVIMMISGGISLVGLTNIIKYGYGYCGYIGIAIVILPFLTVGVVKNRRKMKDDTYAEL